MNNDPIHYKCDHIYTLLFLIELPANIISFIVILPASHPH